ncbi:NAD(P)-dependent oxidoreductase [Neobacillus sp. GCM10023253]|uniref:NAD(P)-dependent oxidoreductase n=1 Tax=Neobacillus sp. GCM10023253 TaxID=3252644 RepID=UPI00361590F8
MKIGFIGIGKMGRWMSENLLDAGYCLTVYDTNVEAMKPLQEKGAIVATSILELGKQNDIVITMLPNSSVVEAILAGTDGLFHSMKSGGIIIDMSSSYVFSTRKLAEEAKNFGLTLIDAPVSGGVKGAKAGTLTIMVGAEEKDYSKVQPILECLGKAINLVGQTGAGHALKAVNNYLSAASLYASCEAMILLSKLGIDLNVALDTINTSSGQSFSTHYKLPTFILSETYNSGFSLDLLLKDVGMVNNIAKDTKVPVLLASLIEQVYEGAARMGEPDQDHTEIIKFLEKISNERLHKKEVVS